MSGAATLGNPMNSGDETDSDTESVALEDVPEETLREMTSITFDCYDRPFELQLLDQVAFKPFRYLKIRNGILVGDLLESMKMYETVDYRHVEKDSTLDWAFPDRVNDLLHKIDEAPKFERLKALSFNYVHRPTDIYEENLIPELKDLRHHKVLYYAKLKDPTGVRPHGNIYCMSVVMGKENNVLFTLEKANEEITVNVIVMPMGHSSLQLTVVTLFEKIFHRIFGPEHVFDYSTLWEALDPMLSLDPYKEIIHQHSIGFMKELVVPPTITVSLEGVSPLLLVKSFVDSMFFYHQAEEALRAL